MAQFLPIRNLFRLLFSEVIMRYAFQAIIAALVVLSSPLIQAQSTGQNLSVTNYQFVSEDRKTRTVSDIMYRADLVNSGPALGSVTATLTSLNPNSFTVPPTQGPINIGPVAANSRTSFTFIIHVDRSVAFDPTFSQLQWSFQTTNVQAPVANAGPNQTVNLGSTVTLNGSASTNPSGQGTLTYSWAFTSRPSGSTAVLMNPTSVTPTFVLDVSGDYIVTLTVSNGTASSSSNVTISTNIVAPVANAGPDQTIKAGTTVHLNGSGSTDANGKPLTYSWTLIAAPSGSTATLSGANTATPTFVADKTGTYKAQLVVNNGTLNSTNTAIVTISSTDTAPMANAGSAQKVNVGDLVQLNGSGSTDVDGDPLTFQWALITVPNGSHASLSNPNIVNPTFTADVAGNYVAQLTVSDGFLSNTATVMITTSAVILPPTANAGPGQTVAHNTLVTLNGSGTDPQSLPLTYMWSLTSKPTGSGAALSSTTVQNPTFFADKPGQYIAQLIVSNGSQNSQPSTVTITTTNTPPVANAGANQNVQVGSTVTLDASGSTDADHDPLTYSWSLTSKPTGSAAALTGATTVSPVFVPDVPGTYMAQLIVSDPYSSSPPVTVTITAASSLVIALTPTPLNLTTAAPGTLTITVPFVAGTNGQVVSLSSSNMGVATVPATVTIPAGSTGANVTVTPIGMGSTNIVATASGLQPGSAVVNVVPAAITLAPNPVNVGVTRTADGTITLSGPAPAGGVTVTLTSNNNGTATVTPSVVIPANSTTGAFTVTGVAVGSATITATANGYASGATSVNVGSLGRIILPTNVTVPVNGSAPFPITLATPAPAGGVTVTLASSDSSTVSLSTTSVFIPAQATTPATQPTVNGLKFGSVTISASAPGFTADNPVTVQVTAALSFGTPTVTITGTTTQNVTLNLSGATPSALTINLASDNTGVATVPSTVTIPASGNSVTVPITGVSAGTANITASTSTPGISSATEAVTVQVFGAISLPANTTVALGQSTAFSVILPAPAPAGGVTVTLKSDSANVTIPGSVTIPANATTPATQPMVTGVSVGNANITASAPGYTSSTAPVNVTATLGLPASATIVGTATQNLTLTLSAATPTALTVNLASSNTAAATVPATVTFAPNSSTVTVPVTGVAPGTTTITASGTNLSNATSTITVVAPLSITTTSLPSGTQGVAYSATVSASGGTTPYTFSATGLPANLTISPTTGQITGTPSAAGTSQVTVTVKDATNPQQTATANFSLVIAPPPLMITTTSLPGGTAGTPYSATVTATGGTTPYTFTATGLPTGLSINSTTGQISGTTQVTGNINVTVTVTDSTNPTHLTATINYTLAMGQGGCTTCTPITVNPLSVGQNLQAVLTISIPSAPAAGSGGLAVTLTSSDASKVLLNGPQGPSQSITVTIPEGQTTLGVFAQGLSIGTATITATAPGFAGSGVVTVTPSGFVISAPDGTNTFNTNQGVTTNVTVTSARLDSSGNVVEFQPVRTGTTATVNLSTSSPTIGTITPSVTFNGGDSTQTAVFTAAKTNNPNPASTTITATAPGFNTPAGGTTVTAFVAGLGCTLPNVTVGRNLETTANVSLAGSTSGALPITISSNDPSKLLLSTTPDGAGSQQISLTVPAGAIRTPDFYVYGVGAPGNVGYTANAGSTFGNCSATATVGNSGLVIAGPFGLNNPTYLTGTGTDSTITVSSALLNSSLGVAALQAVAGGMTVSANVTSSNQSVGTITTSPVTIAGGQGSVTTIFHPIQAGTTTVAVSTPATPPGFSTPSQSTSVAVTVQQGAVSVCGNSGNGATQIGFHLQSSCSVLLSQAAPAGGASVTISTTSSQLLLSSDPTAKGSNSVTINISPGSSTGLFYLQSLASSGSATYTATAPGYNPGSGTATLTPSAVIILGPNPNNPSTLSASVAGGPVPVTIDLVQLDPSGSMFVSQQPLAGGQTLSVSLTSSNPSVGTIASPISVAPNALSATSQFTPKSAGNTTITVLTPTGFTPAGSFTTIAATVTP